MTLKPNATEIPIKIGTKGTVGSLMMKEIEYFNKLGAHTHKHTLQLPQEATKPSRSQPKHKLDSLTTTAKSKKRSNKFLPSICSAIDVADHNGPKMVSGFSYRTVMTKNSELDIDQT
ncbi:hypothetical protein Tco_0841606 [Tanacetum coccineum]|uniref:Uncharacterized protein n=1 Tax=Tanacetum coccineum TaxID=301880 RepID=A0ABQ5AYP3_9ASTR